MGMFDRFRTQSAVSRLAEEALYAEAMREIESGIRRDGIWAMALAEANMDQSKAAARYIKLRVQSLKDEMDLTQKLDDARTAHDLKIRQAELDEDAPKHPGCGGVIDRQETGRRVEWICRKCKKTGKFFLG